MKIVIFLFISLCLHTTSKGQKYALIDRGWKRPIQYVDTVTKLELSKGWFPIYANQMDSLIEIVDRFKTIFKSGMKRQNFNMLDFETSTIQCNISNVEKAYGDRYDIDVISSTDVSKVSVKLSDATLYNRENQQKIKTFHSYLLKWNRKS